MKKNDKLMLKDLRVKSFATTELAAEQENKVRGGWVSAPGCSYLRC